MQNIRIELLEQFADRNLSSLEVNRAIEALNVVEAILNAAHQRREEKWDLHGVEEWERELMR